MNTVRLYDVKTGKLLFVTDRYLSLRVEESFAQGGALEAVLPLREVPRVEPEMLLLARGSWFVTEAVRESPTEGTVTLSASGLLSYLGRRVIPVHETYRRTAEETVLLLFHAYGKDSLPGSARVIHSGTGSTGEYLVPPGGLLAAMRSVALAAGRGLRLTYDPDGQSFTFSSPAPRDRTIGSGDDPVLLSTEGGTLLSHVTERDLGSYKNRALVRGKEKSDGTVYTVEVSSEELGFSGDFDDGSAEVREVLLSPSMSLSSFYGMDGTFDEEAYLEALRAWGASYLSTHRPLRRVSGEVSEAVALRLSPGDLVSLLCDGKEEKKLVTKKVYLAKNGRADVSVTLTDAPGV